MRLKSSSVKYYIINAKLFKNLLSKEIIHLSILLQGEVEQISMMKPKALTEHEEGMLEYLEDIVGSSRFKEPIEEVAKEVEDLNEVRGEKVWTYSIYGLV